MGYRLMILLSLQTSPVVPMRLPLYSSLSQGVSVYLNQTPTPFCLAPANSGLDATTETGQRGRGCRIQRVSDAC